MNNDTISYAVHNFRIQTRTAAKYSMSTHHFHDAYEIYYLQTGSRNYFISDRTYPVTQGDMVLIAPNIIHKTMDTGEEHSRILISFRPDYLNMTGSRQIIESVFSCSGILSLDFALQEKIEDIYDEMIQEGNTKALGYEARLQTLLMNMLVIIARHKEHITPSDDGSTSVNDKVHDIIQYLKNNYQQPVSLQTLSDDFYISRYYLTRVFKKTTGFTILEYVHSLRIVEAQRLLRETDLKIIDVAQRIGFTNVSSFGKVFKALTGQSPLKYRKQHR